MLFLRTEVQIELDGTLSAVNFVVLNVFQTADSVSLNPFNIVFHDFRLNLFDTADLSADRFIDV
jgi:Mlc titration factor MtfA (ptsG expression regulator)